LGPLSIGSGRAHARAQPIGVRTVFVASDRRIVNATGPEFDEQLPVVHHI